MGLVGRREVSSLMPASTRHRLSPARACYSRVLTVLSGAWGAVTCPASRSQTWSKTAAVGVDDSQSDWHMPRARRHRPQPLLRLAARLGPAQAAARAAPASAR